MKRLLIKIIEFYQAYLSFDRGVLAVFAPGGACRFEVSCSEYAKQAVLKHGVLTGLGLSFKRIWRCR